MDTPWQLELLSAIEERTTETAGVAGLWVLGSARQPELVDQWSDLDIGLVLTGPVRLQSLLHERDVVWAVDHQAGELRSTARVVLADGRRLDVVVSSGADLDRSGGRCVGRGRGSVQPGGGALVVDPPTDPAAGEARFVAALALVKYGRGDRLIASHLTLELAQLCLVQAMLLRDADEGTASHRFGTYRDELATELWAVLEERVAPLGLERLSQLAAQFDRLHGELDPGYASDWSGFRALGRMLSPGTGHAG